jgi:hypothetical protein
MRVLSLGWGVQSFTLAAMAALGEIEPVDYAIHADTQHEHRGTYAFAQRWAGWLGAHGVPVVTVRALNVDPLRRGAVMLPAYTWNGSKRAQLHKQCTREWKIRPMRRWLRPQRKQVNQLIGISLDEYKRMKPNDVKYIVNTWPLIDLEMTRDDCIAWLLGHGLEVPPKSSCVFCPFQKLDAWREMAAERGEDWQEALSVDEAIRYARPPADLFIHPGRQALTELKECQLKIDTWEGECTGYCGV